MRDHNSDTTDQLIGATYGKWFTVSRIILQTRNLPYLRRWLTGCCDSVGYAQPSSGVTLMDGLTVAGAPSQRIGRVTFDLPSQLELRWFPSEWTFLI